MKERVTERIVGLVVGRKRDCRSIYSSADRSRQGYRGLPGRQVWTELPDTRVHRGRKAGARPLQPSFPLIDQDHHRLRTGPESMDRL